MEKASISIGSKHKGKQKRELRERKKKKEKVKEENHFLTPFRRWAILDESITWNLNDDAHVEVIISKQLHLHPYIITNFSLWILIVSFMIHVINQTLRWLISSVLGKC